MQTNSRIYVAGHRGLVGSALVRCLQGEGYTHLLTRTHGELDLERGPEVEDFFAAERPDYVFMAAARVGGIYANNTYPVDFLLTNLKIQNNVIEAAWRHGVKGLLFLGSSCIYPRLAPQPLREAYLLSGPLEPTNEPYAIAKIAGIELCEAFNRQYGTRFLSVMPTNLYGPGDSYDLKHSHVLPALIRKFHLARLAAQGDWSAIQADEASYGAIPADFSPCLAAIAQAHGHSPPRSLSTPASQISSIRPAVTLWGSGTPRREFLHSDDVAAACVLLMQRLEAIFDTPDSPSDPSLPSCASRHLFNIGCGEDLTIQSLASMVAKIVGYEGPIEWDSAMPDGTPQKLLDPERLQRLGWKPRISLKEGIKLAYRSYLNKMQ